MTLIFLGGIILSSITLAMSQRFDQARRFDCKEGDKAVQIPGVLVESNGCSKPQGIEVGGEEDFTYCCDRHDACYGTCGLSKEYCDNDFGKCLKNMCKTIFTSNPQCTSAASMYQMATQVSIVKLYYILVTSDILFISLYGLVDVWSSWLQ